MPTSKPSGCKLYKPLAIQRDLGGPLPGDLRGDLRCWWDRVWWQPGEFAPPSHAVLPVDGWAQQTSVLPWLRICPLTISTGQKYATCGNRLEPVTFQWIIENDPDYIKSVLTRVRKLKNRNMQQLYMYLREHYQPESWKKWNALESIEEQLAE